MITGRGVKTAPMRVALLNPCYWPEVRRGSERFAHELSRELIARGHHPRLITSHPAWTTTVLEDDLEIVRHWRPPPERWLRRHDFLAHLTHVPLSYASLRAGEDDLAHALYPSDALAAALWSRRTGRPSIFAYMGITSRRGLTDRRLRLEVTHRAARECTAVTALSRAAAHAFARWLGVKARVIYPPVDLNLFAPGGERVPNPTILCPAALDEPRKRMGVLIGAFGKLRRLLPDARLILSRPRRDRDVHAALAGVPGVEVMDLDDRSALVEAYRTSWLCVLPSIDEAFGLVLAESLACGTPVVGSDSGAIPEIIDRQDVGRLFAPDDEDALVRSMLATLELAGDPETSTACRGRAREFSSVRCADAYLQLYAELLA